MKYLLTYLLFAAPVAYAGGIQLPSRGVKPTARAGAYVAGADDLSALTFNPAGLGFIDRPTLLVDASFVGRNIEYDRVDSGNNQMERVTNQHPGTAIPSLSFGYRLNKRWVLAGGLVAPYASTGRFSEDGPQRYSSVDQSKSLAVTAVFGASYKLNDSWYIGGTVRNTVFRMAATTVVSGCPGQTVCAPEDPYFDATTRVDATSYFAPSAQVGVTYAPPKSRFRIGASFLSPTFVRGSGSLDVRLPRADLFDGATVRGDSADVEFWLAPIARLGIEYRHPRFRVEAAVSAEFWSMLDEVKVQPNGTAIDDVAGLGTYEFSDMDVPHDFRNSYAVHLGGQVQVSDKAALLAGYAYETGATSNSRVTVSQLDPAKHLLSAGASYQLGRVEVVATIATTIQNEVTVVPGEGIMKQINPIRGGEEPTTYVNWGSYRGSWYVFGLGANVEF